MTHKYLALITTLVVLIIISFAYLTSIDVNALALSPRDNLKPLILAESEHLKVEKDNPYFDPSTNFKILSRSSFSLSYKSELDLAQSGQYDYTLFVENKHSTADKKIKIEVCEPSKEVEFVKETIIVKDDTKEKTDTSFKKEDQESMDLKLNFIDLPFGSDQDDLISLLNTKLTISEKTLIDYGMVNFSKKGSYPIYLYDNEKRYEIVVHLY